MSPVKQPIIERPCRAKDPANCRVHGFRARFADLERVTPVPTRRRQPPHPILTDVEPVEKALQATGRWNGQTPTWWAEFEAQAQEVDPGSTPELLDVLDTPIGEVGVVWQKNSPTRGDLGSVERDGMRVNYLSFRHPGSEEPVGYLKATFVDDETFAAAFGDDELTPYRYARRFRGGFYATLPSEEEWKGLSDEEKLPVLQEALEYGRKDLSRYAWRAQEPAIPQTATEVRQALAEECLPGYQQEISWHRQYYSLPYIDFSSTEGALKGKGYGTALYIYAARRLAEDGKVLRGSGLQTEEAQNVWTRLHARFPDHVSIMSLPDSDLRSTEFLIFDLR